MGKGKPFVPRASKSLTRAQMLGLRKLSPAELRERYGEGASKREYYLTPQGEILTKYQKEKRGLALEGFYSTPQERTRERARLGEPNARRVFDRMARQYAKKEGVPRAGIYDDPAFRSWWREWKEHRGRSTRRKDDAAWRNERLAELYPDRFYWDEDAGYWRYIDD